MIFPSAASSRRGRPCYLDRRASFSEAPPSSSESHRCHSVVTSKRHRQGFVKLSVKGGLHENPPGPRRRNLRRSAGPLGAFCNRYGPELDLGSIRRDRPFRARLSRTAVLTASQTSIFLLVRAELVIARLLMCRFSDAGMPRPSPRSDSRRPKSAKARNRGAHLKAARDREQAQGPRSDLVLWHLTDVGVSRRSALRQYGPFGSVRNLEDDICEGGRPSS